MADDAELFSAREVGLQSSAAKFAGALKSESCAGDINFAGDAAAQPIILLAAPRAVHVHHFPDEFVTRRSVKGMVAAKNFDVRVAEPGEPHAYKRPAATESWQWLSNGGECVISYDEGKHVGLLRRSQQHAATIAAASAASSSGKTVRRSRITQSSSIRAITGGPLAGLRRRVSSAVAEWSGDKIEIKCVGSCWSGVEPPPMTEKPGRVSIVARVFASAARSLFARPSARRAMSSADIRIMRSAGISSSAPRR